MNSLVWWAAYAPMWQIYLVVLLSLILIVLIVSPDSVRKYLWEEGITEKYEQHLDSAKTVTGESEETSNQSSVAKSVKGEATQSKSGKTSQGGSGTKTDCSASQTSVASAGNLFSA